MCQGAINSHIKDMVCVYTAITELVILAVGFSHDRSNSFEHFEA